MIFAWQDVIRYQIVEVDNDGQDLFLLEETTGNLLLRKPLTDGASEYKVSYGGFEKRNILLYLIVGINASYLIAISL